MFNTYCWQSVINHNDMAIYTPLEIIRVHCRYFYSKPQKMSSYLLGFTFYYTIPAYTHSPKQYLQDCLLCVLRVVSQNSLQENTG